MIQKTLIFALLAVSFGNACANPAENLNVDRHALECRFQGERFAIGDTVTLLPSHIKDGKDYIPPGEYVIWRCAPTSQSPNAELTDGGKVTFDGVAWVPVRHLWTEPHHTTF